jgi:CheY-like chemotaxis protein
MDDASLLAQVDWRCQVPQLSQARAIIDNLGHFEPFPRERDRLLARLRVGMAHLLGHDNLVYLGYGAHLIPPTVSHVLSVCLIADARSRMERAEHSEGIGPEIAAARIRQADDQAMAWVGHLHGREAWSSDLYDILIPMDKQDLEGTVKLILEHARSVLLMPTNASMEAVDDFILAALIETTLADQGQPTGDLRLEVDQGHVLITTKGGAVMTSEQERDIVSQIGQVAGVNPSSVEVCVSRQPNDLANSGSMPSKIFLVDDEREFVQTLSERLQMRQISSAVVYSGQQALQLAQEDEPELMVLDLKMPGMDGVEVLRRIKRDHPAVEVIILTGHGSEQDRELCMALGAFAFLKKPVDVETLQQTMSEAYEKIKARRG